MPIDIKNTAVEMQHSPLVSAGVRELAGLVALLAADVLSLQETKLDNPEFIIAPTRNCPRCLTTSVIEDGYCGACREETMPETPTLEKLDKKLDKIRNAAILADRDREIKRLKDCLRRIAAINWGVTTVGGSSPQSIAREVLP